MSDATAPEPADIDPAPGWRLSSLQVVVLVLAVGFLAAAAAYVVGDRSGSSSPFNEIDVGFIQDMSYHHDQATEMSLILLGKDDVDRSLKDFAQEIIIGQRYEQGIYSALLDRYGYDPDPGDTVMDWMGLGQPAETMEGLATPQQIDQLKAAAGPEAEALWISLMSEHHLAGLHMADYAARHGQDRTVVNLAKATVKNQRSEVIDLARFRTLNDIAIAEGFTDPTNDQRLNPISFDDQND